LISVIIPTHNRHIDLSKALLSVFVQTDIPAEVIVIDDASKPSLTDEIFKNSPVGIKCILLTNEVALGANYSRNFGVKRASCAFIAFLDDDDIFLPTKLETLKSVISENNTFDIFYHRAIISMENEGVSYLTKPQKLRPDKTYSKLMCGNFIGGTPMVIVRREVLLKTGGFDVQMPALQDYELWIRLARLGYKFFYIDQVLTQCHYYTKRISISKSIESNEKAVDIIYNLNKNGYSSLSRFEYKEYESWKFKNKAHKYLLNLDYFGSVRTQFGLLNYNMNFQNLIRLCVVLCGPRFTFFLKGKGF